jgi:hypothetical protein
MRPLRAAWARRSLCVVRASSPIMFSIIGMPPFHCDLSHSID